jgi:hypothetical protein
MPVCAGNVKNRLICSCNVKLTVVIEAARHSYFRMALFTRRNPMQKIETELAALNARSKLLTGKRAAAQSALDSAVEARQKALLTGDLDDTKGALALQTKVDTATSALAGFDTAITAQAALIAEAEAKLASERQVADRKAASDTLAAQAALVEKLLGPWLESSRDLASALDAIHWRFESAQMGAFIRNAAGEVENAHAMTSADLQHSIKAIRDGGQDIPAAPAVIVAPAPVAQPVAVAAEPAKAPLFHRVDRPSYQMKLAARG